ncbi:RimK family alpha-L-glutamate ligase [Plantactinospora sp. GCM10030261]|uniref:ATP-grasp domain-containing protein n=1 Tax=Plantactinospora sp. GCM10030261 TaxID=3273420 RepID=UPI0036234895
MNLSAYQPTRGLPRVALVSCGELPDGDPDDRLLIAPLRARGIEAVPAVWDDPAVDWTRADLTVIRSTWDYPTRRDEFVAWAGTVPGLANPADIVEWNTDKRYLGQLAAAGVATVPTEWIAPDETWRPPATGEYVIKPAVSGGSRDTGRYNLADPEHRRAAVVHLDRLAASSRVAMVQPYLTAVDQAGETALMYVVGPRGPEFSHAVRKGPMLTGPDPGTSGLYLAEKIEAREPRTAELELADGVLAAVPGGADRLLYARVDVIPGPDGTPMLVEVELTEPSLFLSYGQGAADRLAEAIAARLG